MNDRVKRQERTDIFRLGGSEPRRAEPTPGLAHLVVIRGRPMELGRAYPLSKTAPTTIGRGRGSAILLSDPRISGNHARISLQRSGGFVLVDLQSTNGTQIDGRPVAGSWSLRDREKIFVGDTVLLYTEADETELGLLREPLTLLGTDPLTGLVPKRRFDDALDNALASARLIRVPLAMLMLDIDNLGFIDKRCGASMGTRCIAEVGRVIGAQIGAGGHACRYWGDDFCAFLPRTDRSRGLEVAERIRAAVEGLRLAHRSATVEPTLSIGVAAFPEDGDWVPDLICAADRALYRAKSTGKNRVSMR